LKHRDILLALGGGGARGIAHVGVLQALEEAGYRVRGVAGTSIGSVIGGLYCAGRLPQYMEFLDGLDLSGMLRLLDLRLPFGGLMGGRRIESLLRKILESKQIEDLEIPFISVTTELSEGHEVRLVRGDLAQAMRASFAIPGFFTPVLIGGRWLVDGGVSTPVPVLAAQSIAELPVLAVNVNSSGQGQVARAFDALYPQVNEKVATGEPKLLSTLSDSIAHLQFHLASYQIKAHPPAYTLEPGLRGVGLFDFNRAKQLVDAGRIVAETALHSGELQFAIDQAAAKLAQA
jgi:NTE family protein